MARVCGFHPAPGRDLYRGELSVRHMNSRTKSISYLRLDSMSSFRFLEWVKTRLVVLISFRNGGDRASCGAWAGPQLDIAQGGVGHISFTQVAGSGSGSGSGSSAELASLLSQDTGLSRVKALPFTRVRLG
jgi:hypothetical protein